MSDSSARDRRLRRYWDRQADAYERKTAFAERRFFADTRTWLCGQAVGDTLEVAIGTGLNLAYYPADVRLTAVEWSPAMLAMAQRRADALGRQVDLRVGDARALGFPDGRFDTVICTFALCGVRDERLVLAEMARILRPGGLLLLADHVESSARLVRLLQGLVDLVTVPLYEEHYRHRPLRWVRAMGFTVERHDRMKLGIIERFAARKPGGYGV